MADDAPTAEEFATWLIPGHALARVIEVVGNADTASNALIRRMRGGALRAAAKSSALELEGRSAPPTAITLIFPDHWGAITKTARHDEFWKVGDVRFFFTGASARRIGVRVSSRPDVFAPVTAAITYFGVRIDPAGIDAWLADLLQPTRSHEHSRPKPASEPAPLIVPEELEAPKGPPVPETLLRGWYDLYQQAYGGSPQDTEAIALKSALGMFPGKSVSRDRIRALRGAQKIGRKSREVKG